MRIKSLLWTFRLGPRPSELCPFWGLTSQKPQNCSGFLKTPFGRGREKCTHDPGEFFVGQNTQNPESYGRKSAPVRWSPFSSKGGSLFVGERPTRRGPFLAFSAAVEWGLQQSKKNSKSKVGKWENRECRFQLLMARAVCGRFQFCEKALVGYCGSFNTVHFGLNRE